MPIVTGEWFNSGSRPMMKSRSGAVTADVEQGDVGSCAVDQGSVATCAMTSQNYAAGSVTCNAVKAGHIVSEKASSGLQRRSYSFVFAKATSTETGGAAAVGTTAIEVWRPSVAINVLSIDHMPLGGKYGNATCDNFTLYGNAGTCIGHIPLKTVSTGILRGTRTCAVGLTQVALAADTPVLVKLFTSTCSETVDSLITVHYQSSN